jgi:AcrR family transcriptional regulator
VREAAAQLLIEQGYAAASTNAIARRAGVSIGSLYQYYRNKDAIFREILAAHHAEMRPIKQRAIADLAAGRADIKEVIARTMEQSLAIRKRDPELMIALHRELAGVIARWDDDPGADDLDDGTEALAQVLSRRLGHSPKHSRERAWLTITVLEEIGRKLVHDRMRGYDRDHITELTVSMLDHILHAPQT